MILKRIAVLSAAIVTTMGCQSTANNTDSSVKALSDVNALLASATSDGELDLREIQMMFAETGNWISSAEGLAIYNAIMHPPQTYTVSEETKQGAKEWALYRNLRDHEVEALRSKTTLAGDPIPDAVIELLSKAKLSGAIAYDVDYTSEGDDEPRFNPHYSSTPEATENMTWQYTQVVPAGLERDLAFTGESNWMKSRISDATGVYWDYEAKMGGTGMIVGTYDEIYHPDIYARTRSGSKWAHNCGVLSDGSFHCLPASRRNFAQEYILVNPDLSRGSHMMYNGHIEARQAVIYDVELSGKLSKLSGKGKNVFVNPICLLKAWGYSDAQAEAINLRFDTNGDPERVPTLHAETCTLRKHTPAAAPQ